MVGEAVWPITYKGKRFKVNDRDRVLYEMVKKGEITEAQLRRFQRTIPNEAIAAETAVAVRKARRDAPVSTVPEGEVRPGASMGMATGTAALNKYRSKAAIAAHRMMDVGLIDFDEAAELLLKADNGFDIDDTYGLAAYLFEIAPNELMMKLPDVTSTEQVVAAGPSLVSKARGLRNAITAPVGDTANIATGMRDWLNTWYDENQEGVRTGRAAEEELTRVIESLRGEGEIASSTLDRLQSKIDLANILNEEDAKAIADEIASFDVDLDVSTVETLKQYTVTAEERAAEKESTARAEAYLPAGERTALEAERGQYQTTPQRRQTLLESNNLRTVEDFARYEGIIPFEEQMAPDVIVEGGGLQPFFEHDIPENYFYDSGTGKAYDAQAYQRLLQGQSAFQQQFQWDPGAEGPMTEYMVAKTRPLSERGRRDRDVAKGYWDRQLKEEKYFGTEATQVSSRVGVGSLFPDESWERQSWSSLHPGSARIMADNMTPTERRVYERKFADNGLDLVFSEDDGSPIFRNPNTDAQFVQMLGLATQVSRGQDIHPLDAIGVLGVEMQRQRSLQQAALSAARSFANSMAVQRQPFQVPAGLRSIPSQKEIAQDVKERFRIKLGRDPTMVELDDLAAELTGYHQTSTRDQIDLAYAEWEGSSNIMDGADLEEVISNPALVSTFDMEQKWANEINLNERQEVNAESFNRIRAATGGTGASLGALPTSGTNVVGV